MKLNLVTLSTIVMLAIAGVACGDDDGAAGTSGTSGSGGTGGTGGEMDSGDTDSGDTDAGN